MRVLVTGGARSGKSRHAESLLPEAGVTYVAPGPSPEEDDDPDWAARIRAHRQARPSTWHTLESSDLVAALGSEGPVIVDALDTWLSALLDSRELWQADLTSVTATVEQLARQAADVVRGRTETTVLVSSEVGLGVVPSHRSGRLFRDLLGMVNQEIAEACDEVHLVIAGRVLKI